MNEIEGRCLCGAVRFAIALPTLFFSHCHCRWCREAHSAPFVSWVGAAESRFRLQPESAEPRWYQSSPQSRRGFCATCGTTLFYASTICPGEVHVARTTIPGAIDRKAQCHVFYDQRVEWAEVGDHLPRFASDDPGLAKFRVVKR